MTLRDQRQEEFADLWLLTLFGILNLAPRFGKCRVAINAFKKLKPARVLIAYPDNKIKVSWQNEFKATGYSPPEVVFTTYLSLKKYVDEMYDVVVLDEIHLMSPAQLVVAEKLLRKNMTVMGLTGTLAKWTARIIKNVIGLDVIAEYSINKAIQEGVVTDYEITVIEVPLDTKTVRPFKKWKYTEKQEFDFYTRMITKLEMEGKETMFMRFGRMRVVQNSLAKANKTMKLLEQHKDERILVFCGTINIAENLGIPCYHSKSEDRQVFEDFSTGAGNHLAVVKIGNTGVTYKPLNRVIINYFDSNSENMAQKINRCMSMEYDNPGKMAKIYIICSNEDVERKWLTKALEFFDSNKIKYIR